jgi:translation initiation factor 3 subunit E
MTAGEDNTKTSGGEEWDLTPMVAPYLDRHMVLPLLEFLKERVDQGQLGYSHADLDRARLELARPTHMVDFVEELYRSLHGNGNDDAIPSQELQAQKLAVYDEKARLEKACEKLDKFPADERVRLFVAATRLVTFNYNFLVGPLAFFFKHSRDPPRPFLCLCCKW